MSGTSLHMPMSPVVSVVGIHLDVFGRSHNSRAQLSWLFVVIGFDHQSLTLQVRLSRCHVEQRHRGPHSTYFELLPAAGPWYS